MSRSIVTRRRLLRGHGVSLAAPLSGTLSALHAQNALPLAGGGSWCQRCRRPAISVRINDLATGLPLL